MPRRTASGSVADVVAGDPAGAAGRVSSAWSASGRWWSCRRRWGRAVPSTVPSGTEKLTSSTATVSPKCLTRSIASTARGAVMRTPQHGAPTFPQRFLSRHNRPGRAGELIGRTDQPVRGSGGQQVQDRALEGVLPLLGGACFSRTASRDRRPVLVEVDHPRVDVGVPARSSGCCRGTPTTSTIACLDRPLARGAWCRPARRLAASAAAASTVACQVRKSLAVRSSSRSR